MAASSDIDGSDLTTVASCPLCDDYEGRPEQVESHISGKTDEAHKGSVGRDHREEIEQDAEEVSPTVPDSALAGSTDLESSAGVSGDDLTDGPARDRADGDLDGAGDRETTDSSSVSDSSMPPGQKILIGSAVFAVALLVVVLVTRDSGGKPATSKQQATDDDDTDGGPDTPLLE